MPITLTKITQAECGQSQKYMDVAVETGDLIFAGVSASGGASTISIDVVSAAVIKQQHSDAPSGDITGIIWIALGTGTARININGSGSNLDAFCVVFRPSAPLSSVNGYVQTKRSGTPVWTDELTLLANEYLLCWQYSSTTGYNVDSTPQPGHKGGTATCTVDHYSLPEGANTPGNSFFEVIKITAGGSFKYYGPNPTMIRVTVQGDPMAAPMAASCFVLV